jgi:hypothetical protein
MHLKSTQNVLMICNNPGVFCRQAIGASDADLVMDLWNRGPEVRLHLHGLHSEPLRHKQYHALARASILRLPAVLRVWIESDLTDTGAARRARQEQLGSALTASAAIQQSSWLNDVRSYRFQPGDCLNSPPYFRANLSAPRKAEYHGEILY